MYLGDLPDRREDLVFLIWLLGRGGLLVDHAI